MASQRKAAPRVRKQGIIRKLAASKAPKHPTRKGVACVHYVEYRENGKHVDSATFPTAQECADWLRSQYKIEA